jgi:thiopeptide-type bacteriocin biosynthesis protein
MNHKNTQREFIVGDHWLYYKVYTGYKTADLILTDILLPLANLLEKNNLIEKWFFIRYADPEPHLRIRFYMKDKNNIGSIISVVYNNLNSYIEKDLIWKIQIDTYNREIERYGNYNIINSENYFHIESKMIINFLSLIEGDNGEELRWLFSIKAIDSLLDVFNYDDQDKLDLLERLKTSFGKEFNMSRSLKKQLDNKFRKENNKIIDFLNQKNALELSNKPLYEIIRRKEVLTKEIAKKIFLLKNDNKLEIEVSYLTSSYIHMFMNRLFKSNNRMHEMVIYDFMYRIYNSRCARKKYINKSINS